MNYRKVVAFWSFFLILDLGENQAHERDMIFRTLSVNDGLIQSAVNGIEEDAFGFMWFGTREGASRYDGLSFTNYYFDPSDSTSIYGNNIKSIMPEKNGQVWFGSDHGISIYNPFTGLFTRLPFDNRHVNFNRINKLIRLNNEFVFVGTENGIKIYDSSNQKFVEDLPGDLAQLKQNSINEIIKDREGNWWIATGGGLFLFNKLLKLENYFNVKEIVDNEIAYPLTVFDFSDSYVSVGTNFGILIYDRKTERIYRGEEIFEQLKGKDIALVHSMGRDREGNVWFAGNLFFKYSSTEDDFYFFDKSTNESYPELFSSTRTIKINSSGILWVGTYGFGIRVYDPNKFHIGHISASVFSNTRLAKPYVTAIFTPNDSILYVANAGGINEINLAKNSTRFRIVKTNEDAEVRINSIIPFGKNYLLLGTDDGLLKINLSDFTIIKHILKGVNITSIFEDRDNSLWVSTQGFGILNIDPESFEIKHNYLQLNLSKPNNNRHNFNVVFPKDTVIWIGSEEGLFFIDRKSNKVFKWKNINNKLLYDNVNIKSIYLDSKGNLWLGTWGMGLFKYIPEMKMFRRYGMKEGLPNSTIYSILEDQDNNLWMSSNKGIIKFNPETEIFTSFYNLDNLQSFEFNTGSYYKSSQGVLYFGGINGLNIINPEDLKSFYHPIKTYFTRLIVNHSPLEGFLYSEKFNRNNKIHLAANENSIEVEYIGLDYSNGSFISYEYKLEGFNKSWVKNDNFRKINFTNLPSGEYLLRVRSSSLDGNRKGEVVLPIIIATPLVQTIWFKIIVFIVLVVLIYTFYSVRIYSIKKKKEVLEKLVEERTLELIETVKKLNKSNNDLNSFTYIASHDLKTPLRAIANLSEFVEDELKENKNIGKANEYLKELKARVYRMDALINGVLKYAQLKEENFKLEKIDHIRMINHIKEDLAKSYNFDLIIENKISSIWFSSSWLHLLFKNLIKNSIVHSDKNIPKIIISFSFEYDGYLIGIADNGPGIKPEYYKKVFKVFQTLKTKDEQEAAGIGLFLVKQIMDNAGGKVWIEPNVPEGVVFKLVIPAKENLVKTLSLEIDTDNL